LPEVQQPVSFAPPSRQPVVEAALKRAGSLRAALAARRARVVARARRTGLREMRAELSKRKAELRARAAQDVESLQRAEAPKRLGLELKVLAATTQIASLAGGPPEEAQALLAKAKQDLASHDARVALDATRIRSAAAQELVDLTEQSEQGLDRRTQTLDQRLRAETEATVADYQAEVKRSASMPGPGSLQTTRNTRAVRITVPAPPPQAAEGRVAAPVPPGTAARERLLRFITEDVRRRVSRLAALHGWRVSYAPIRGAVDKTAEIQELLRSEWRP
jgi:hypothetical protein